MSPTPGFGRLAQQAAQRGPNDLDGSGSAGHKRAGVLCLQIVSSQYASDVLPAHRMPFRLHFTP